MARVPFVASLNGAGVSPPGDSLIYCRAFARRQELIGSMTSDLRAAARDRVRRLYGVYIVTASTLVLMLPEGDGFLIKHPKPKLQMK
jgi:hypothetical protein